jgi:BASS family bile acid:Na+ symporter
MAKPNNGFWFAWMNQSNDNRILQVSRAKPNCPVACGVAYTLVSRKRLETETTMNNEQLNQLTNILASITLFEMMVAIGLGVSIADLLHVAADWRLVTKAALASYVCVPAAAVVLLIVFQADPLVAAGFLICAVCPGAPYGPPFTGIAKGNVGVSVGLMVILAGSSALAAPLLLQLLLPLVLQFLPALPADSAPLAIDGGTIVMTLLVAQFLPLCAGLGLRQWRPALADRLMKPTNLVSMVLNLTTLSLILFAQFEMLIGVPIQGYIGMLLLVLGGVAAGLLLGGKGDRSAMVMATSVRNVGVSLVIVTAAFAGTRAVAAATVFALFQTIVMALIAVAWGRLAQAPAARPVSDSAVSGAAS